jgi:HEAT repeat
MTDANRRYEPSQPRTSEEIIELLGSGDASKIISGLHSAAFHEIDWRWVQSQCLRFLNHPDSRVRWAAATFLGDIAAFHHQLDVDIVLPALEESLKDPDVRPAAQESMYFIRHYVKSK